MTNLLFIFNDQLSHSLHSLRLGKTDNSVIVFCEAHEEATYVKHHQKKIAFLWSAQRHFAQELAEKGLHVEYIKYDPQTINSIEDALEKVIKKITPQQITITEPSEWRLLAKTQKWRQKFGIPVETLNDDRFLSSISEFKFWAQGKKQLRMEYFYRYMRKQYNILLNKDGTPTGDQWNYDFENRSPIKEKPQVPKRISHKKSTILNEVLQLVEENFSTHFGVLKPFHYAITREQALQELEHFINIILPNFGTYQDAMQINEPYLYHSLLSSYLNAGLLLPLEICEAAEKAYHNKIAPLNAVEGFIRQILGWREYVRGIYWHYMPEYAEMNFFAANKPLPEFYWHGRTNMRCLAEAIKHTREHAYSHHIQRLMITGNFALLAGLDVKEVQEWYLIVYSDAFEWVEMPNTLGMALFGDGGLMASKPYAASGKYINRMSNFCQNCQYDPELTTGPKACPFNALYWDFIARNHDKLNNNQRLRYVLSTWNKFTLSKQQQIRSSAAEFLKKL
jgi:deoxyribodipyrimidine photolyase-related protein